MHYLTLLKHVFFTSCYCLQLSAFNFSERSSHLQRYASLQEQKPKRLMAFQESKLSFPSGIQAQVLSCNPQGESHQRSPLVFLHGSFHAAWCWTEYYFDFFTSLGYPVAAYSFRGTGGTFAGEGVTKVTLEEHVSDLKSFLELLPGVFGHNSNNQESKPVVIAHSFAGLVLLKYLELYPDHGLAGVVTMCSVPPSGNVPMTMRFLKRSLVDSYKITVGFALKRCTVKEDLCRDLLFGGKKVILPDGKVEDFGISDDDIRRYQSYFARDTVATIDVSALLTSLPSKAAGIDGKTPHLTTLPPCMVVGANRDFVVDRQGVLETSEFLCVESPVFVDSPHDVMLGSNWKLGADVIHDFIEARIKMR